MTTASARTTRSLPLVDPVVRRESLFEQASQAAYRAVLAISQHQESEARGAIDELRFLKSLITTGEPNQPRPDELVKPSPLSLQRMRLAFDAIRDSDAVIQPWVQHNLTEVAQGDGILNAAAWQRLIDHALPEAWNFESDLMVVHGAADPGLIDALKARGQRRVLVIAPADEADAATPDPDRFVGNDVTAVAVFIEGLSRPYPKTYTQLQLQRGAAASIPEDEATRAARQQLEEGIRKAVMANWMNHNTRRHFAERWVQQGVGNIPAIAQHPNLHALDHCFRGRPAILIAPGPSLDKNIDLLRQAQDKAVLIAPLQSLRRLFKAGIRPDFITVLDATDLTTDPFDFFNDVPDAFLTTLVVAVNCHPRVIQRFERVYFFSGNGPLDRWVQDIVPEPLINLDAPSVALSGLMLAQHWGCQPIVLTGHDLALAGDRRYAEDAQLNNLNAPQLMTLPGYHGGTVQSPSDYFLFHHQFEQIAAHLGATSPHTRLYNCTEGGAFIRGFVHEPLQSVLEAHVVALPCSPVVDRLVDGLAMNPGRQDVARTRLIRTLDTLDELRRQVRQLQRLTQQPRPNASLLRKLAEQEQALRAQLKRVQGFATVYQDDIDHAVRSAEQAKTLQDNLAASRALYQVITDGCDQFRPLVQQALEALEASTGPATERPEDEREVNELA